MKLKDILNEVQIIDAENADQHDRSSIDSGKFYIYIHTLQKELLIGPFNNHDEAEHFMKEKTTSQARQRIVVNGEEARKFL